MAITPGVAIQPMSATKSLTLSQYTVFKVYVDNVEQTEFTFTVPAAKVARIDLLLTGTVSDS